jgi:hypothetical protein
VAYTAVLAIPLIVLTIVLLIRIIVLRVAIAISPILILAKVFEKQVEFLKKFAGDDGLFSIKSITQLLVAPILISFAVSISTMFIILLKNVNIETVSSNEITNVL